VLREIMHNILLEWQAKLIDFWCEIILILLKERPLSYKWGGGEGEDWQIFRSVKRAETLVKSLSVCVTSVTSAFDDKTS
jgi:hypothetical protein